MALPATDNFNRADGGIGTNWTAQQSTFNVLSNQCVPSAAADTQAFWNADSFNADHYSQVVIATNNDYAGVAVRCSGTGAGSNSYTWLNASLGIYKLVSGTYTNIQGGNAISGGDTIKFTAEGTSLKIFKNAVQLNTTLTDSTHDGTSSAPGIYAFQVGAPALDDWEGDNIAAAGGGAKAQSTLTLMGVQ